MRKILCISLGYEGGCVYYANQILKNFPKEKMGVWNSHSTFEPYDGQRKKVYVYRGFWGQLISWVIFLPYYSWLFIKGIIQHKYDKILIFGPHNWDVVFILLSKAFNVPSYLVIHDGVMHLGEESQIHQKLMNIEMRNVKYWILLSNYVRCRLEKHLNCQKPYCTIPHGPINYSNICCSNNIPKKYNLLFIGRINYYKGIHLLMDAINYLDFNKIDNIIIAGVIDKSIDVSILRQYRQVKIINKFLSNEEFEELVLKSHILLMPYLEASQSGIAAISLGYNIPAIATRVGGLPEQLSEDVAYFMEDISSIALTKAISLAISDSDLYIKKKKNLSEKSKTLNWEVLAKQLFDYINIK